MEMVKIRHQEVVLPFRLNCEAMVFSHRPLLKLSEESIITSLRLGGSTGLIASMPISKVNWLC